MNGPLVAAVMVLAVISFLGWVCWAGLTEPGEWARLVSFFVGAEIITGLMSLAWGLSGPESIGVMFTAGFLMIVGWLRQTWQDWLIDALSRRRDR